MRLTHGPNELFFCFVYFKWFLMSCPHQHNLVLLVKGVRIPSFAVHGGMSHSNNS